jgi:hypothetical protein
LEEVIQNVMVMAAQKYPVVLGLFSVIGLMRAINKPLFAFLRTIAKETVTTKDDTLIDSIEQSKVYKSITFVLDWALSVKLPPPKSEVVLVKEVEKV